MKVLALPLYFSEFNDREMGEMKEQLQNLETLYGEEAEFLTPQCVDTYTTGEEDVIIFPHLTGAVFQHRKELETIKAPIFVLTSSYGTVEMWDWEIVAYLRENTDLQIFTPYQVELGKVLFRAAAARKAMKSKKFVMFQDSPGEGMQAYIFKRFYWWEKECIEQIENAFGVQIVYKSWNEVNEQAECVRDEAAKKLLEERHLPCRNVPEEDLLKSVKLYIAIRDSIKSEGDVIGTGSNCLNESMLSGTTPCLAWSWIFEYDHIMWCCEGDLVSLISMYILYSALGKPLMMTNLYPFLVGMAALKHEKIDHFPEIEDSDNCALGVHCGYFGFAPQCFCKKWTLVPKVLEIVNDHALMVDCEFAKGEITMAKLHADMKKMTIIEGEILDYVQYPGSDCRNGCLIHYRNRSGHKVMEKLSSHHAIIIQGNMTPYLLQMAQIYGFETEII